jgi:DNA-binding IclR family transcriptional regulator
VPPRWLSVLLAAQPPREVQQWPSLASVVRTTQRPRRSVIRIVRALEERGLLNALPRNFAVRQAGAT